MTCCSAAVWIWNTEELVKPFSFTSLCTVLTSLSFQLQPFYSRFKSFSSSYRSFFNHFSSVFSNNSIFSLYNWQLDRRETWHQVQFLLPFVRVEGLQSMVRVAQLLGDLSKIVCRTHGNKFLRNIELDSWQSIIHWWVVLTPLLIARRNLSVWKNLSLLLEMRAVLAGTSRSVARLFPGMTKQTRRAKKFTFTELPLVLIRRWVQPPSRVMCTRPSRRSLSQRVALSASQTQKKGCQWMSTLLTRV